MLHINRTDSSFRTLTPYIMFLVQLINRYNVHVCLKMVHAWLFVCRFRGVSMCLYNIMCIKRNASASYFNYNNGIITLVESKMVIIDMLPINGRVG